MKSKTWNHGNYFIHVLELNKDELYDLVVAGPNQVGTGHRIAKFNSQKEAFSQGEQFARNFADAIDREYVINGNFFIHQDGRKVHFSNALDKDRTQANFISLLERGEF